MERPVEINIPVAFRRRGVETRIVIEAEGSARCDPDPGLISLIAQAYSWFAELTTGETPSVRELVKKHGADQGDVSRILSLAFLAPDIVESLLAGSQPIELTVRRMKRLSDLPFSWSDQHRYLGFTGSNV